MNKPRYLPDAERLSVLTATIVLAYAMTRFVQIPASELAVQLPGFYLNMTVNLNSIIALLVAGLTASGADWLLRDHPDLQGQGQPQHTLLPALTAWAISIPLAQIQAGPVWWLALAAGAALVTLTVVAEYVAVDAEDIRYPLAAAGLTAVSFALYLILAVTLRAMGPRLFLILPALTIAGGLVGLRALHLRLPGEWAFIEAGVIGLILGQITAALNYWPLSPISFGLLLLGAAYALSSLIVNLVEEKPLRQAIIEPGLAVLLACGAALWLR
jgi:hypothetical protein